MTANDKKIAEENTEYIINVIKDAEKLIKNFAFTVEDKQAFFDASASIINENSASLEEDSSEVDMDERPHPKVLGKIDLKEFEHYKSFFMVPNEDIIIEQIKFFTGDDSDVSLKGVVEMLVKKGYDRRLIYSLTNLMVDKGILELYKYTNEKGFESRGVKIK